MYCSKSKGLLWLNISKSDQQWSLNFPDNRNEACFIRYTKIYFL